MGRVIRRSSSGRRHHADTSINYNSIEFDGISDYSGWDYNQQVGYIGNSNDAYMWRLPGSTSTGNNSGTPIDWSANSLMAEYGETAMSVAFWIKPHANPDNSSYGNVPVRHTLSTNYDIWKPIWKSSKIDNSIHSGILVGIFSDGATNKNYFMMHKGDGMNGGNTACAKRIGTTTIVASETVGYTEQWFHAAFVWNTANQTVNGPDGWEMYVNGIKQTNAFDSTNIAYRTNETNPGSYSALDGSNHNYTGDIGGGGWGRSNSAYLAYNMTDFGYWHGALQQSDVSALYNNGVRTGRTDPTEAFTVTY